MQQKTRFLESAGWNGAICTPLAGDASSRSYQRLVHRHLGKAVLMDAPAAKGEDIRPFQRIGEHLASLGLSPPLILAADAKTGFLLLEDLGDGLIARLVARDPALETPLYEAAIDTLVEMHRHAPPDGLPMLGVAELSVAVDVAMTWYAAAKGPEESATVRKLSELVRASLDALPPFTPVLALRDFHAENLLWLPEREGAARIGLLDFQDAFAGHPAYDLISLLEDARRDVSVQTRTAALARFAEKGGHDPGEISLACATLGAQRNLRILGVFARLCMHFGKAHYVDLIPRVWGHLMRDLGHPALAGLAGFVRDTLPEPSAGYLETIREKCGTCPMR